MNLGRFFSLRSGGGDAIETPLFLLGFHRGGTTFVQRAVNCSRDIHVLGEHGGILSFYRQAFDRFSSIPKSKLQRRSVKARSKQVRNWSPLENALDQEEYLAELRRHVRALFAVRGMARWGFKEIHYHAMEDVRFLTTLFPACRIAFLHRDPEEMFLSHYFVHWNTAVRDKGAAAASDEFAAEYRSTMQAFRQAEAELPNAEVFEIAELGRSIDDFGKLADFAHLPLGRFDRQALEEVFATRVGSSFGGIHGKGIDADPQEIDAARAAVQAALARSGGAT